MTWVEDSAAYRERLEQILARREFRAVPREGQAPTLPESDLPSFLRWIVEQFRDFLIMVRDWLRGLFGKPPEPEMPAGLGFVSEPLALVLGLVAVALTVLVVLRLRRMMPGGAGAPQMEAASPRSEAMPDALARPADAWARFADEFRRQGEWRLALRALYLRILVVLHERGAIHYERQRTNGEYVTALAGGVAGEHFSLLTTLFDQAWYGNKPIGEDGFRRAMEWVRAVDRATAPREAT